MAREGNEKVFLLEPGAPTRDNLNQLIPGKPKRHQAWARRRDIRGRERERDEIVAGRWPGVFVVRINSRIERMDEEWQLEDRLGRIWEIESVLTNDSRTHFEIRAYRVGRT